MLQKINRIIKFQRKLYCPVTNKIKTLLIKNSYYNYSQIEKSDNIYKNSNHFEKNNTFYSNKYNDYKNKLIYKTSNKKFSLGYRAEDLDAKPIQKNKYDNVKLSFGREARNNLLQGIKTMSDNVAITYGPLGKNVVIDYEDSPIVTKDGVTVAKHINLRNRQKNIGCRLLSIIAGNTNEYAGDGTTTATVLAGELSK